jgi:hypothetical protein
VVLYIVYSAGIRIVECQELRLSLSLTSVMNRVRIRHSVRNLIKLFTDTYIGVCLTDLRLDTSKNGLKQVYSSPEAIY